MTAFCIWQYTDHVKFGNIQCFQHTDRARFGKIMTMQRECLSIVDLCGHCERGEGRGSWKGVVLHVSSLNKDKKDHVHGSVADSLVAGHTFTKNSPSAPTSTAALPCTSGTPYASGNSASQQHRQKWRERWWEEQWRARTWHVFRLASQSSMGLTQYPTG